MILHTVNKSPFSHDCLASCLRFASAEDTLLLIEDGVYGAIEAESNAALFVGGITVLALEADVRARGLAGRLRPDIQLVDYSAFVDLAVTHRLVQSWF